MAVCLNQLSIKDLLLFELHPRFQGCLWLGLRAFVVSSGFRVADRVRVDSKIGSGQPAKRSVCRFQATFTRATKALL